MSATLHRTEGAAEVAAHTPAFLLGVSDFQRGHKTNPFPFGRGRRGWAAGFKHAATAEEALPLPPAPNQGEAS